MQWYEFFAGLGERWRCVFANEWSAKVDAPRVLAGGGMARLGLRERWRGVFANEWSAKVDAPRVLRKIRNALV
jgi:hypothetical protein